MTVPKQPLPNTSVCPRCGAGLRCGMLAGDAECWCVQLPNIMPVPAAPLPQDETPPAASCLCPACLKQITDVSIHAPFGANYPPEGDGFKPDSVPDEQPNKLLPARD